MTAMSESQLSAGAAARQSTLSSRISNVLATSYTDQEIREAIAILDSREFVNSADSRRNLRLDLQEEVVRSNAVVIDDFKSVADELRRVELSLSRLTATCAAMRAQIKAANKITAPVLEESNTLLKAKAEAETKEKVLGAFQKHFLMAESEISCLTSTSDPVDSDFFATLYKLKRIHADSRLLLSSANDRLGLSILENSTKTLNAAFQKLFRWTQKEFKTLDLENPQLGAAIRKALRILAEKPQLFAESLDNFASARGDTLSDSFHAALTGQGDTIVGKPIEFQAHDPVRYISDMLAWVHSATVSEREALEVLFIGEGEELARGIQEGRDNDPWSRDDNDTADATEFDGRKSLNELVSRNTAGIARQLRQRTEQVIQSQEDATTAYKISNLVSFYILTFQKLLGEDADIGKALRAIEATAQRQFRETMADQVSLIQSELSIAPTELSPPEFFIEALDNLKLLLKSYDTSLASTTANDASLEFLLQAALDPFLDGCHQLWLQLPAPKQSILALNCLLEARAALADHSSSTTTRLATLDPQLRHHASLLTEHQHTQLLARSGIAPLLDASADLDLHHPLARAALPALLQDVPAVRAVARRLDEFLPIALMDAMDALVGLRSARLAREVTEEAAERFCDEFALLEQVVLAVDAAADADDGDVGVEGVNGAVEQQQAEPARVRLRDAFPRTTEEIRVLLS